MVVCAQCYHLRPGGLELFAQERTRMLANCLQSLQATAYYRLVLLVRIIYYRIKYRSVGEMEATI